MDNLVELKQFVDKKLTTATEEKIFTSYEGIEYDIMLLDIKNEVLTIKYTDNREIFEAQLEHDNLASIKIEHNDEYGLHMTGLDINSEHYAITVV